jgi:CD109 antigen
LKRALDYLAARVEEIDEPYLLASYALAAMEAGDWERARKETAKLRALAHEEDGASYWSLETNTPFYGWGLAGRVETTALVVQALARAESEPSAAAAGAGFFRHQDRSITQGLLFLLRAKDRYGVWYSTQATINVLDALLVLLNRDVDAARQDKVPPAAEIMVNGRSVKSVDLPAPGKLAGPIKIDLHGFIQTGANRIEIKRGPESSPASVQAVATYYLPWPESIATQKENWRARGSSSLRLVTTFDKTESNVSDQITCHVEAERIGFSGYGMLLAEIGLPPGADVDRASLDSAMKGSDWSISQYDVLPDRLIVYLWPRAGGTKFDFKFRPRFGLRAQTAASMVYDYYNPEARAIVAPTRFVVK